MLREDSRYCTPEVLRFCCACDLRYIFGVAATPKMCKLAIALEAKTTALARPKNCGALSQLELNRLHTVAPAASTKGSKTSSPPGGRLGPGTAPIGSQHQHHREHDGHNQAGLSELSALARCLNDAALDSRAAGRHDEGPQGIQETEGHVRNSQHSDRPWPRTRTSTTLNPNLA